MGGHTVTNVNRGTQTTSNQRVAANVERLLTEHDKTRDWFAHQMEWSRTTVWRRVVKAERWYLDEVDQAADIFGVEPDDLTAEVSA